MKKNNTTLSDIEAKQKKLAQAKDLLKKGDKTGAATLVEKTQPTLARLKNPVPKPKPKPSGSDKQLAKLRKESKDLDKGSQRNLDKLKDTTDKNKKSLEKTKDAEISSKEDVNKALEDEQYALEAAKFEAEKQQEESEDRINKVIDATNKKVVEEEAKVAEAEQMSDDLTNDIAVTAVNPNRWFENRSVGQTVALMFAGVFANQNGNLAAFNASVDSLVTRDVNAQISNLDKLKGERTRYDNLATRTSARVVALSKIVTNKGELKSTLKIAYLKNLKGFATEELKNAVASGKTESEIAAIQNNYNATVQKLDAGIAKNQENLNASQQRNLQTKIKTIVDATAKEDTYQQKIKDAEAVAKKKAQVAQKLQETKNQSKGKNPTLAKENQTTFFTVNSVSRKNQESVEAESIRTGKVAEKNYPLSYLDKIAIKSVDRVNGIAAYFASYATRKEYAAKSDNIRKVFDNRRKTLAVVKQAYGEAKQLDAQGWKGAVTAVLGLNVKDKTIRASFAILFAKMRKEVLGARPSDKDMELIESLMDFSKDIRLNIFELAGATTGTFADLIESKRDKMFTLLGKIGKMRERKALEAAALASGGNFVSLGSRTDKNGITKDRVVYKSDPARRARIIAEMKKYEDRSPLQPKKES